MTSGLRVRLVTTPADRAAFVDFAWEVYRGDPAWVPPLKSEVLGLIDPKTNPWFGHARAALWLAERDGRIVGRISAQVDSLVQVHRGENNGYFGMLEAPDDSAVFAALFAAAEQWLRDQGMERAIGPFSLNINQEIGALVEGFDTIPNMMMGHGRPCYDRQIQAQGYAPAKDLLCYEAPPDLLSRRS